MALIDIFYEDTFYELSTFIYQSGILVFLLVFTLAFAALEKSNILGNKKYNIIIALALGLMVIVPHYTGDYPPDLDVVNIINNSLPQVSLLLIAVLSLLVVVGLLGTQETWMKGWLGGMISLISFLFIIWIFGAQLDWWGGDTILNLFDDETWSLLIIIAVFIIVLRYITSDDTSSSSNVAEGMENFFKKFGGG